MNTKRTLTVVALLLLALAAVPAPTQALVASDEVIEVNVCSKADPDLRTSILDLSDTNAEALLDTKALSCEEAEDTPCTEYWWQDKCDVNGCDFDSHESSAYCREVYCTHNPDTYPCREQARCENGFMDRDTDKDKVCDQDDDDIDGDGVPNERDEVPYAGDPVNNAISCGLYMARGGGTECVSYIV